jgi:hypothetical protein
VLKARINLPEFELLVKKVRYLFGMDLDMYRWEELGIDSDGMVSLLDRC